MEFLIGLVVSLLAAFLPTVQSTVPLDYFPDAVNKIPYAAWLLSPNAAVYDRHTFLPKESNSSEGAAIFWSIYEDGSGTREFGSSASRNFVGNNKPWIQFAVAVQASE